jgi:hypothetical protein
MDPVKILDHYRLPLIHSGDAIQVLAYLLRGGPQTLNSLSKNLKAGTQDTSRQLTILYRASLVKKLGSDLWEISPLGEQIISYLGLDELATADLADKLAINECERVFFKSWLRSSSKELDSKTCLSLFISYRQTEESEMNWWEESMVSPSSIKYAIMIASDRLLHYTGIENGWLALRYRQKNKLPQKASDKLRSTVTDSTIAPQEEGVKHAWEEGMKHYAGSNRIFLLIGNSLPELADKNTLHFTLLRTIDAIIRGSADEGLRASCSQWEVHDALSFWNSMFRISNVEEQTRDLCYKKGWLDQPLITEDLVASLVAKTMKIIRKPSTNTDESKRFSQLIVKDPFEELVDLLGRASARIETEGGGVIPEDVHSPLLTALDHLSSILRKLHDNSLSG